MFGLRYSPIFYEKAEPLPFAPKKYDITCQYNSNVLTLVAVTYYVVGLFDVIEVY